MGFLSDLGGTIKARLNPKTIAAEVFETITDRVIPHGAAELAHALNTQGSGYVPYGQASMPVEPPETASPPIDAGVEPASVAVVPSTQEQYEANLSMFAGRGNLDQDQALTV